MREHRLLGVLRRGVHQHHRVERAGAAGRGMGALDRHERGVDPGLRRLRLEGDDGGPIGAELRLRRHRVQRPGMPDHGGVEPVVVALGGVDGLGAADLLRRLAEQLQGAGHAMRGHRSPGAEHRGERCRTQHRMRVGMAGGIGVQALARRRMRHHLLRIARHGVVFGETGQHRLALAPAGDEGRGHAARARLHGEALGAQQVDIVAGGSVLAPGRFGMRPDAGAEGRHARLVRRDPVERRGADAVVVGHSGAPHVPEGGEAVVHRRRCCAKPSAAGTGRAGSRPPRRRPVAASPGRSPAAPPGRARGTRRRAASPCAACWPSRHTPSRRRRAGRCGRPGSASRRPTSW